MPGENPPTICYPLPYLTSIDHVLGVIVTFPERFPYLVSPPTSTPAGLIFTVTVPSSFGFGFGGAGGLGVGDGVGTGTGVGRPGTGIQM